MSPSVRGEMNEFSLTMGLENEWLLLLLLFPSKLIFQKHN